MKRFTAAYLFTIVILTLLANLVFILLYGRQFLFEAAPFCQQFCAEVSSEPDMIWYLFILNVVLLILFALGYLVVRLLIKSHK